MRGCGLPRPAAAVLTTSTYPHPLVVPLPASAHPSVGQGPSLDRSGLGPRTTDSVHVAERYPHPLVVPQLSHL